MMNQTTVPALDRSVALLDLLANAKEPMNLGGLAQTLEIPKSSCHHLLQALVVHGLLQRDGQGNFTLGTKSFAWATAFNSGSKLIAAFHDSINQILELHAETVMLAVLDGTDVTYLACHAGSRPLAVNFRVGGRFTASCTSSGKAMLASFEETQIKERYSSLLLEQRNKLPKLTKHSLGNMNALYKQLPWIRAHGYAIDDEETAEGMQCFGAPVFGATLTNPENQHALAGVAVSTIKASMTHKRQLETIGAIRLLAAQMTKALGGKTPESAKP